MSNEEQDGKTLDPEGLVEGNMDISSETKADDDVTAIPSSTKVLLPPKPTGHFIQYICQHCEKEYQCQAELERHKKQACGKRLEYQEMLKRYKDAQKRSKEPVDCTGFIGRPDKYEPPSRSNRSVTRPLQSIQEQLAEICYNSDASEGAEYMDSSAKSMDISTKSGDGSSKSRGSSPGAYGFDPDDLLLQYYIPYYNVHNYAMTVEAPMRAKEPPSATLTLPEHMKMKSAKGLTDGDDWTALDSEVELDKRSSNKPACTSTSSTHDVGLTPSKNANLTKPRLRSHGSSTNVTTTRRQKVKQRIPSSSQTILLCRRCKAQGRIAEKFKILKHKVRHTVKCPKCRKRFRSRQAYLKHRCSAKR